MVHTCQAPCTRTRGAQSRRRGQNTDATEEMERFHGLLTLELAGIVPLATLSFGRLTVVAKLKVHVRKVVVQRGAESSTGRHRLEAQDSLDVALLVGGVEFAPLNPLRRGRAACSGLTPRKSGCWGSGHGGRD